MSYYYFTDLSHHKGDIDIQTFADAGHRLVVTKASDNYHLPDKEGKYDFSANRHYDSRFVDNYVKTRDVGLIAGAYHFCRWDRPIGTRQQIVQANLDYFRIAVSLLPEEHRKIKTVILDMEQPGTQLKAAGLSRTVVSSMAKDMVELFLSEYDNLILYAGSWWTNEWLTTETTEWMAERMGVWEPEYVAISNNLPYNVNYSPSVPRGFSNEYATTADDLVGKMFAWQFSAGGRFPGIYSNIDINQTMMPKEELYKLFHQDGAVDPPTDPTDPPEIPDKTKTILQYILGVLEKLSAYIKSILGEL